MDNTMALLQQAWHLVLVYKTLDAHTKITSITLLMIAVWKSSFFKPSWDKLGTWKFAVPGIFGLVLGLYLMPEISAQLVWESIRSGMLAIALHKLTLGLKEIPAIGPKYQKAIAWMENLLRKPAQAAEDAGVKDPVG